MSRIINIFFLALVVAAATWTYQIKHVADERLAEIRAMEHQIELERETIDILEADWAYLSNPARLQTLISRYKEELGLSVTEAAQLVTPDELPPPAPVVVGDEIGEILAGDIDLGTTGSVEGN